MNAIKQQGILHPDQRHEQDGVADPPHRFAHDHKTKPCCRRNYIINQCFTGDIIYSSIA